MHEPVGEAGDEREVRQVIRIRGIAGCGRAGRDGVTGCGGVARDVALEPSPCRLDPGPVLLRDAAQDGVGQAGRARRTRAHELHALVDRHRGGRAQVEQLEAGDAQRVAHARLEVGPARQVRAHDLVEPAAGRDDAAREAHGQVAVALGEAGERRGPARDVLHAPVPRTDLADEARRGDARGARPAPAPAGRPSRPLLAPAHARPSTRRGSPP